MAVTYKRAEKRDERIAIRLSRRTKFALERYAQRQEVSASAVINEVLMKFLTDPEQDMLISKENGESAFFGDICWDSLTPDRFLKIATMAPEYLSEDEQIRWKVIAENTKYFNKDGRINFKKVRDEWSQLGKQALELMKTHG